MRSKPNRPSQHDNATDDHASHYHAPSLALLTPDPEASWLPTTRAEPASPHEEVQHLQAFIAHLSEINDAAQVAIERLRSLLAIERTRVQETLEGSGVLVGLERKIRQHEQEVMGVELFDSVRDADRLEVSLADAVRSLSRMQSELVTASRDLHKRTLELARSEAGLRGVGETLYESEIGRNVQRAVERQLNDSLKATIETAATAAFERARIEAELREVGEQLYISQADGDALRARAEEGWKTRLGDFQNEARASRKEVAALAGELYEASRQLPVERNQARMRRRTILDFLKKWFV